MTILPPSEHLASNGESLVETWMFVIYHQYARGNHWDHFLGLSLEKNIVNTAPHTYSQSLFNHLFENDKPMKIWAQSHAIWTTLSKIG